MSIDSVYKYRGTVSIMSSRNSSAQDITLAKFGDEEQPPIRLSVYGPLAKYIYDIEGTDAEERYIESDWYYDRGLTLRRIEVPSRDPAKPAKVITQEDVRDAFVTIFGCQDYIETEHPEPMSSGEYAKWRSFKYNHPERLRGQAGSNQRNSFDSRLASAKQAARQNDASKEAKANYMLHADETKPKTEVMRE